MTMTITSSLRHSRRPSNLLLRPTSFLSCRPSVPTPLTPMRRHCYREYSCSVFGPSRRTQSVRLSVLVDCGTVEQVEGTLTHTRTPFGSVAVGGHEQTDRKWAAGERDLHAAAPPPTPKPSPIAHPTFTAPLPTPEGQTMYRRRSSALSSGDRGRRGAGRPLPSVASPPLPPFRKPMPPLPSHLRPVHLPRHLIRRVGPTVYSALQSLLAGCKALHTFTPPLSTNERTGAEG